MLNRSASAAYTRRTKMLWGIECSNSVVLCIRICEANDNTYWTNTNTCTAWYIGKLRNDQKITLNRYLLVAAVQCSFNSFYFITHSLFLCLPMVYQAMKSLGILYIPYINWTSKAAQRFYEFNQCKCISVSSHRYMTMEYLLFTSQTSF